MSPLACIKTHRDFQNAQLGTVLQLAGDQGYEIGYPHNDLMAFFADKRIRDLVSCSCGGCPTVGKSEVEALVTKIRNKENSYVGVLSFLVMHREWYYIFEFIKKGFSDQKLSTLGEDGLPVISEDEFIQMLQLKSGGKSTAYVSFFRFFMPVLRYQDRSIAKPRRIHQLQILPFNITKSIGKGGYSTVYEAQVLPGYHDFNHEGAKVCDLCATTNPYQLKIKIFKDGRVALKIFNRMNDENLDCFKEMENNVRYSHPRVMPLQAAIVHKGTHMHVFPLAGGCLKEFFDHDPPKDENHTAEDKDYTAKHWWNEFAELLGAVHHIHTSRPGEAGFHFDLKVSRTVEKRLFLTTNCL